MRRTITAVALSVATVLMLVPSARAAVASSSMVSHGRLTSAVSASVVMHPASVARFSPNKGPMGTKVTIIGSGFAGASRVAFHGVAASFNVVSNARITATVPCGTTGGRITVSTPKGRVVSAEHFRVT